MTQAEFKIGPDTHVEVIPTLLTAHSLLSAWETLPIFSVKFMLKCVELREILEFPQRWGTLAKFVMQS